MGLLASQSLPYFSTGSSFTTPTTTSALFTNYTYDPLQRVLIAANAVGTTTDLYAKWTTTTTDPDGNVKDYTLDAFGNLAQVVEHIGTMLATTSYTYDALNDLATTTDSMGNVRAFSYDGLSRRLSAQDLHAPGHSPFGIWQYSYDNAGNLISQVDAKGSTTTRTYDVLNRLLTESNASTTQITNTYDSCTNGIGYLCVASSTSAKTQNSYDILGRITFSTTTIASKSYATGYTYDRQSNMLTLASPNNIQTQYGYNIAGLISSISAVVNASSTPIETIASYAPTGKPSLIQYPTGVSTTYTYDPAHLYRLTRILTATTTSMISTSTVPVPLPDFSAGRRRRW